MKAKYYSTSELASKTGTSRQVISAIINGNWREKRISKETHDRITQAMDEIGYVPDRTAISLRKEKRDTIGLLCHGPLYSHALVALEKLNHYFLQSGKPVEIHVSSEGDLTEAIRKMMGRRVEKIIILLSPMLKNFGILDFQDPSLFKLLRVVPHFIYNFPFEVHEPEIEEKFLSLGSHFVGFSRNEAYLELFRHLQAERRTRILVDEKIHALFKPGTAAHRICASFEKVRGYENPQIGKFTENTFALGEKLAEELISLCSGNQFDYLITSSDGIAQGAAARFHQEGIRIPKDLGIIGFDKIDSLEYLRHEISTIEVPVKDMTDRLIHLLDSPPAKSSAHKSVAKLHLR